MAAAVLNSPRAVETSLFLVRAFVRLREFARGYADIAAGLEALEHKVAGHDVDLKKIIAVLRGLVQPPTRPRHEIGFRK